MSDKPISQFVEDMFPSFYKEEGPLFIQFVKAYYEWLEQQGNVQYHIANLPNDFDVDKTIDEFITHFRQQYLPSLEFSSETDKRLILKHAREFLTTKGTEENIELLLRLVYDQDSSVFRPNEKVLRASDGVWYEPKYLELTPSEKTVEFIGRNITGSQSGATALAERVVRKTVGGVTFDVLYISQVKGNFLYKEIVTSDGVLDECPKVIGSLTTIDLVSGGKDFAVGDVVSVESSLTGKSGLARVANVGSATGRVTFDLIKSGFGFTNNATVYVSDHVINLSGKTPDPTANSSNGRYVDFTLLEEVVQPLQTVSLMNLSNTLTVNTFVRGHASNGQVIASGYVVGSPVGFSSNNQTIKVIVHSGSFTLASDLSTVSNTITGIVDVATNTYATGVLVGTTNNSIIANTVGAVGVAATTGTFTSNTPYAYVYGRTSNTFANVFSVSTGSGATFDVGLLTNTEEVFINTDRLAANNVYNQPFMGVKLISTGFIDDVLVVNGTPNTTHLFVSGGGTLYTEGDIQNLVFTGGTPTTNAAGVIIVANGVVTSVVAATAADKGSGYSNNQPLVFVGNTRVVSATLSSTKQTATILSGNTLGLYVGLAVKGDGIPSNTFISSIDAESGALYLTNAPSSNSVGVALEFPASGYITTNTSGSITAVTITSQGSGYTTAPSITVTGGTGANLTSTIANGVVVDTRVDAIGSNYASSVVVSATTSGVPATLQASIDSGYGFEKDPNADLDTILANALTSDNYTLGSIASLTGINLGANYNQDPFVLIIEPVTVGYNRRDFSIAHDNALNTFVVGELITQNFSVVRPQILYSDKNINDFIADEIVVQGDLSNPAAPRGLIFQVEETSASTGAMILVDTVGTFVANSTPITGATSGAVANVATVSTTSSIQASRGRIKSVVPGYIGVERLSFNLSFTPGVPITGSQTGTVANVVSVTVDESSLPIGFNAQVDATAGTVEGFIQAVQIVDSGFAYKELEPVELKKANNVYIAAGYARLRNQGAGEGYFLSERGFLNDSWNYLHDNDYWQEYSYEVRTGISLVKYGEVLKQASHVAGTKLFGAIERTSEMQQQPNGYSTLTTSDTAFWLANGTSNTVILNEVITINGNTVGYANGSVYSEFVSSGYVDIARNTTVYVPNTASAQTTATIRTHGYTGTSANVLFITADATGGILFPSGNSTAQVYTNTNIVSVANGSNFTKGSVVYQIPTSMLSLMQSGSSSLATNSRDSSATYRTANNRLAVAGAGITRPNYSSNGTLVGLLYEPARTNLFPNSSDLSATGGWTLTRVSVISNDINDLFGDQAADKILATAEAGTHEVKRNSISVTAGERYTISCLFRKAEYNHGALTLPASRFGVDHTFTVNLTTGVATSVEGTATAVVEQYADNWYRLGVSAVATSSGTGTFYIRVAQDANTISFTPSVGTNGIHAFGAQLENGYMTTLIPSAGSATTRAKDTFALTNQGWSALGNSVGVVANTTSNTVAIAPLAKVSFNLLANNGPAPVGYTVEQNDGGNILARGTVVKSTNTALYIDMSIGPFAKTYGPVKVANAHVLLVASNSTSNAAVLQVGEIVTQNTGSVSVQGTVYSKNSSHVVVTSANGPFVASSNNTTRLKAAVSGANVYITNANTLNIPISTVTRTAEFTTNSHLVGETSNSYAIVSTLHNSVAKVDTIIIPMSNAINKLSVSDYTGTAKVGDVIRGVVSNTTATITKIER